MLNRTNCIFCISMLLLANLLFGASSGNGKTSSNKGTCHEGWKKRNTQYKPQWGPSLCGNSTVKVKTKKQAKKRRNGNYTNKLKNDKDDSRIRSERLPDTEFIKKLQEIHSIQMTLLEGKNLLTQQERLMKRNKIRSIYRQIAGNIEQTNDFPFPNQMWNMESVLSGIRKRKITSEIPHQAKTDRQLLKDIQAVQLELCKKTIDLKNNSDDMNLNKH